MSILAQSHSVTAIPLSKLVPWGGNVRRTGISDGVGELKASIAAHGILQSLVVRKTTKGKYAVVAGGRRYLALSALAQEGAISTDEPVPCQVISRSIDATEISLTENVVRAPMHPADQFEAFRDLVESGSTPADIAARFGIAESAVKKRLRLARVSPTVFDAYRKGDLSLEHVQAFAIVDDHDAQDRVFADLPDWNNDPESIRDALTEGDIPASDKRVRFVTFAAYEEAGGAFRRDLFAEGDEGVYLLDHALLDRLTGEKLASLTDAVKSEGWKWVEAFPEGDYETRAGMRRRYPERLPLSAEAEAERKTLSEEYGALFDTLEEGDEETSERLDAIEARIAELEDTGHAYNADVLAMAGAIITLRHDGEVEIIRGLVCPEDEPEGSRLAEYRPAQPRPEFSSALVHSLTEMKSAGISASLAGNPDVALAAVVHALAGGIFYSHSCDSALQLSAKAIYFREESKGRTSLTAIHEELSGLLPEKPEEMWQWCLSQDHGTLLKLLAFCAATTVNGIEAKHDSDPGRLAHANALSTALNVDITAWFTPTTENFFLRVPRTTILAAIEEATGKPVKRSWQNLKKAELAAVAERETAGKGWLPKLLRD